MKKIKSQRTTIVVAFVIVLGGCSQQDIRDFQRGQAAYYKGEAAYHANNPAPVRNNNSKTPMFYPEQCVGSVINGKCSGTLMPTGKPQLYCYGTYTAYGECVGTINY